MLGIALLKKMSAKESMRLYGTVGEMLLACGKGLPAY